MSNHYFKSGQWNVICDVCGKRYKIGQVRKRWDGLIVCDQDFEQDHPQKYLKVKETGQAVPLIRDEPIDNFKFVCTFKGTTAYTGLAVAGCSRAGHSPSLSFISSLYDSNCIAGIVISGVDFTGQNSFYI